MPHSHASDHSFCFPAQVGEAVREGRAAGHFPCQETQTADWWTESQRNHPSILCFGFCSQVHPSGIAVADHSFFSVFDVLTD